MDVYSLRPGDRISCKLFAAKIVEKTSEECDEIRTFEVVARESDQVWIFVPQYVLVKGSRKIAQYDCREMNILSRFLGEEMIKISDEQILKLEEKKKGMTCKICHDHYDYAESNQMDGTLICFACRSNPYL